MPKHIYITFWGDRNWYNKLFFLIYKAFRLFIVSVWYYFIPFIAMISSFLIPAVVLMKEQTTRVI